MFPRPLGWRPCEPSLSCFPIKSLVWQRWFLWFTVTEPWLLPYPTPGLALTSARPSTGHLPPRLGFLSSQSLLVTGLDLLHLQVDLVSHLLASAPCCSPPPTSHPSLSTRSPHFLWRRTRFLSWPTHRKCCQKQLLTGFSVTSITQAQSQDLGLHPARSHREHSASCLRSSSDY